MTQKVATLLFVSYKKKDTAVLFKKSGNLAFCQLQKKDTAVLFIKSYRICKIYSKISYKGIETNCKTLDIYLRIRFFK